jgi:hypothetical protein
VIMEVLAGARLIGIDLDEPAMPEPPPPSA